MGVVEGTSYTVIIIAAIAMAGTAMSPEVLLYACLLFIYNPHPWMQAPQFCNMQQEMACYAYITSIVGR